MVEFATSPGVLTVLSGGTTFKAKRAQCTSALFTRYAKWAKRKQFKAVSRSFFYNHAFGADVTDRDIEECVCSKCHQLGTSTFKQLRNILDWIVKVAEDAAVTARVELLRQRVDALDQFMRGEMFSHFDEQSETLAHCANAMQSSMQDRRFYSECTHHVAEEESDEESGGSNGNEDGAGSAASSPTSAPPPASSGSARAASSRCCTTCDEVCSKKSGALKVGSFECVECCSVFHEAAKCFCNGAESGALNVARTPSAMDVDESQRCAPCIDAADAKAHPGNCEECNEISYVLDDICCLVDDTALISSGREEESDALPVIKWMKTEAAECASLLSQYRAHKVRHFQQTKEKTKLVPTRFECTAHRRLGGKTGRGALG